MQLARRTRFETRRLAGTRRRWLELTRRRRRHRASPSPTLWMRSCWPDTHTFLRCITFLRHAFGQVDQAVVVADVDAADETAFQLGLVGDGADDVARLDAVRVADLDAEGFHADFGPRGGALSKRGRSRAGASKLGRSMREVSRAGCRNGAVRDARTERAFLAAGRRASSRPGALRAPAVRGRTIALRRTFARCGRAGRSRAQALERRTPAGPRRAVRPSSSGMSPCTSLASAAAISTAGTFCSRS